MLFAVTGAWAAIQTTFPEHRFDDTNWIRLIMSCNLGLVFSLSASTFAASLRTVPWLSWLLRVFVVVLVAGYYFTLPAELLAQGIYRFFLLAAAGHLLLAVAPFWELGHTNHFWFYLQSSFFSFLTSC